MVAGLPQAKGLYDPRFEHDACGVGLVCDLKGRKSHKIIQDGLQILVNLTHRGACGQGRHLERDALSQRRGCQF